MFHVIMSPSILNDLNSKLILCYYIHALLLHQATHKTLLVCSPQLGFFRDRLVGFYIFYLDLPILMASNELLATHYVKKGNCNK